MDNSSSQPVKEAGTIVHKTNAKTDCAQTGSTQTGNLQTNNPQTANPLANKPKTATRSQVFLEVCLKKTSPSFSTIKQTQASLQYTNICAVLFNTCIVALQPIDD